MRYASISLSQHRQTARKRGETFPAESREVARSTREGEKAPQGQKEIPNVRTYVSVDGGMTDNIRYALYQSAYTVVNAGKADKEPDEIVTVAGKCCESGDLVQEHTKVAKVEVGDTLAVLSTGAYNYSMASNYNRIPRPAIVMVKDGKARVVVKRESYEDIVKNDI